MVQAMMSEVKPVFEGARDETKLPETIAALAEIPAVAGCHIMAPGNDAAVPQVISEARRSVARLQG